MAEIKDGGPAFPNQSPVMNPNGVHLSNVMSLRDWFTGQALSGLIVLSTAAAKAGRTGDSASTLAAAAYELANAILAEWEREHG